MFFFFFFILLNCVPESKPLLDNQCEYMNTLIYECDSLPSEMGFVDGFLKCNDTIKFVDYTNDTPICVDSFNNSNMTLVVGDTSIVPTANLKTLQSMTLSYLGIEKRKLVTMSNDFSSKLNDSIVSCSGSKQIRKSCQFIASACALSMYYPNSPACSILREFYPSYGLSQYGYEFWPVGKPFLEYSAPMNRAIVEHILTQSYSKKQIITIQLARYNKDGEFLGFVALKHDIGKCMEKRSINQAWRIFGANYLSECLVDLNDFAESTTTDFFEPFLVEDINSQQVLRPFPILVKNYLDADDTAVNMPPYDTRHHRVFRRFFLFDNYSSSSNGYIQFLKNMSLIFQVSNDGSMLPPYLILEYDFVSKLTMSSFIPDLIPITNSSTMPLLSFSVLYNQDFDDMSYAILITAAVLFTLAFCYWLFKTYVHIRRFGEDGLGLSVSLGTIGILLLVIGVLIFCLCFSFAAYLAYMFKYDKASTFMLPFDSELSTLSTLLVIALVCVGLSLIIRIGLQACGDVFIIDWEEPRGDGTPISAWRRVMIANEWLRLSTFRSYSIPFTVFSLLLVLTGMDYNLISSPIPTLDLVSTGKSYLALRFALISSLWIVLVLLEWLYDALFKSLIFGCPFKNFLDLCGTANSSILMMISNSWGYYVHGRSAHGFVDQDIERLNANIAVDAENHPQLRPIAEGYNSQVYQIYFSSEFRYSFRDAYDTVLTRVYPAVQSGMSHHNHISSVTPEAMASFEQLNQYLCRFFVNESIGEHRYTVSPAPFSQRVLGLPPNVQNDSIVLESSDKSFRKGMLSGIQWTMLLFNMLLFIVTETITQSSPIAAMVTYIADILLVKLFQTMGRSNLAKKSLLDDRFLLD